jgi:hypothetical protein
MDPAMIDSIARLIAAVAWPLLAMIAGLAFKKELRALIGRIRKGGVVEFDPAPQADSTAPGPLAPSTAAGAGPAVPFPRTPATQAIEGTVRAFPALAQADDPHQREETLVTIAARALLMLQFERTESSVWRSQLSLLNHLNAKVAGESLTILRQAFYDPAAKEFPDAFANYSFEAYMGFLLRNGLVEQVGESARLTQQGLEFLAWRIEQHKPPKAYG